MYDNTYTFTTGGASCATGGQGGSGGRIAVYTQSGGFSGTTSAKAGATAGTSLLCAAAGTVYASSTLTVHTYTCCSCNHTVELVSVVNSVAAVIMMGSTTLVSAQIDSDTAASNAALLAVFGSAFCKRQGRSAGSSSRSIKCCDAVHG
jgi:hypothetical protein